MDKQEREKQSRSSLRTGVIAIASVYFLSLIINFFVSQWSPEGSGGKSFYRGPVLPLSVLSGGELLEAERHVDFDFAPYETESDSPLEPAEAIITDCYQLTNTGAAAVTAQLVYPFDGSLNEDTKYLPTITVDGTEIDASLHLGVDAKEQLPDAGDWEEYRNVRLSNDFLAEALAEAPEDDTPVTVYKFTEPQVSQGSVEDYRYIKATYAMDPVQTTVWTYGPMTSNYRDETHYILMTLPSPDEYWVTGEYYMIVVGPDITDLQLEGYYNSGPGDDKKADTCTANMEKFQSTFSEMVMTFAEGYGDIPKYDHSEKTPFDTPEFLYPGAMKRIADENYYKTSTVYHTIDGVFDAVLYETVPMYCIFPVEIAPGQTVTVEASFHQQASSDVSGMKTGSDCFDLATKLGSQLTFTKLSSSVANSHLVEIQEQNFGFDLAQGISHVELSLEEERYYMNITARS